MSSFTNSFCGGVPIWNSPKYAVSSVSRINGTEMIFCGRVALAAGRAAIGTTEAVRSAREALLKSAMLSFSTAQKGVCRQVRLT